jgi:hypothetical protein
VIDRLYLRPFRWFGGRSIDRLFGRVTVAGTTSNIKFGLWGHDYITGRPTGLTEAGIPAICIEARQAKAALGAMPNKTDRNDARGIAQIMRTGWYRAVYVKSPSCRSWGALLTARRMIDVDDSYVALDRRIWAHERRHRSSASARRP